MDYNSRIDFYKAIYDDYSNNHTESFIFRFFKEKKERKAERKGEKTKSSRYVSLQKSYRNYKEKQIRGSELFSVIEGYLGSLSRDEMAVILSGDDGGTLSKKEISKRITEEVKRELKGDSLPPESITVRLVDGLCNRFIDEEIRNYFFDIGCPDNIGGGRRNDYSLDMLFAYIKEKRSTDKKSTGKAMGTEYSVKLTDRLEDPDYINDCMELYELLNDIGLGEGDLVFVPVYIDTDTGLGIYIIGGDIINDQNSKGRGKCYFCCIRFDFDTNFGEYIVEQPVDNRDKIIENRLRMSYLIENGGKKYNDLGEAIKDYRKIKNGYRDYNGYEILHEPVSEEIKDSDMERFLRFFIPPDEMAEVMNERQQRKDEALRQYREKRSVIKESSKRKSK